MVDNPNGRKQDTQRTTTHEAVALAPSGLGQYISGSAGVSTPVELSFGGRPC